MIHPIPVLHSEIEEEEESKHETSRLLLLFLLILFKAFCKEHHALFSLSIMTEVHQISFCRVFLHWPITTVECRSCSRAPGRSIRWGSLHQHHSLPNHRLPMRPNFLGYLRKFPRQASSTVHRRNHQCCRTGFVRHRNLVRCHLFVLLFPSENEPKRIETRSRRTFLFTSSGSR